MTLDELLAALPPTGPDGIAFPQNLLGAFRRRSITFCNGLTDETTVVYWFQSRSFTIDLRLPDGAATPVTERQGWTGDTLWDEATQQMSWAIDRSYQPRNQWPEPARLAFIGNSVLEFAPSGAYVEDWRQQCTRGRLLGLRLHSLLDETTGQIHAMDGGLIVAGDHAAYAQSRLPSTDDALRGAGCLRQAVADGIATQGEIESCEVSVATGGLTITHGTQPYRCGQSIASGDFAIDGERGVVLSRMVNGAPCQLRFAVDINLSDWVFDCQTPATAAAQAWFDTERGHLMRNATIVR